MDFEPAINAGHDNPCFLPRCIDFAGKRKYIPHLARIFGTVKKLMFQNHDEYQLISVYILQALPDAVPSYHEYELSLSAIIRDVAILSTFTGSNAFEYTQSQAPLGYCFKEVPRNAASGLDGVNPIAFMRPDFSFCSTVHL